MKQDECGRCGDYFILLNHQRAISFISMNERNNADVLRGIRIAEGWHEETNDMGRLASNDGIFHAE